jgi:hypothetical protein
MLPPRHGRLPLLLLTALAAALVAGPAAAATWTGVPAPNLGSPSSLSLTGDGAGELFATQLAQPGDGGTSGFYLSTRVAGGAFTAPARTPDAGFPAVAGDDAGDALSVATSGSSAVVRVRPYGGVFGAPLQTIAIAAPTLTPVAFARRPDGAALAAWADGTTLQLADRPAGTTTVFGAPVSPPATSISGPGFGSQATSVPLALPVLDADGAAAVVLSHTGSMGAGYSLLQTRRAAGGTFTAATALASDITLPAFASNAAGDAIVVWRDGNTLWGAFRPRGGGFGAAQQFASAPDSGSSQNASLTEVSVALTPGGLAQVVWERYVPGAACSSAGGVYSVATATRGASGTWSAPSYAVGNAPIVAASTTDERTALLWDDGGCAVSSSTVYALKATLGAPAGLTAPEVVAGGGQSDTSFAKTAAFDGTGAATVLWLGDGAALHGASTAATATPTTPGGGGTGTTGDTSAPHAAGTPSTPAVTPPSVPPKPPATNVLTIGIVHATPGDQTLSATQSPSVGLACDSACQASIGALTTVGGPGAGPDPTSIIRGVVATARTTRFTSKAIIKKLKAHGHAKVTIKLSAKARRAVKAALKAHRPASVVVTIHVKGSRKVAKITYVFRR